MLIAIFEGKRVRAKGRLSGATGICPWSKCPVKAKVGEIRQYWSYSGEKPVMPEGYENETIWHYNWKSLVRSQNCEVVFGENNEHRADIVGNDGVIIEIQKSPLDIRLVKERIDFYKRISDNNRVIWVVDATPYFKKTFDIEPTGNNTFRITWKPKRLWTYHIAKTPYCHLFLDINYKKEYLLKVWVHKSDLYCSFVKKQVFYNDYLKDVGVCKTDEEIIGILTRSDKQEDELV